MRRHISRFRRRQCRAAGIALRLDEDILRAEGNALGFDDAQELTRDDQCVVGGAVFGRVLGDRMSRVRTQRPAGHKGDDLPALRFQERIDSLAACCGFRFVRGRHGRQPLLAWPSPPRKRRQLGPSVQLTTAGGRLQECVIEFGGVQYNEMVGEQRIVRDCPRLRFRLRSSLSLRVIIGLVCERKR
jgi:hypothetical protein